MTEKLQSHLFAVTETLNSDVIATVGKTPPYRAVQNLKFADAKKLFYVHLSNVLLHFTELNKYL